MGLYCLVRTIGPILPQLLVEHIFVLMGLQGYFCIIGVPQGEYFFILSNRFVIHHDKSKSVYVTAFGVIKQELEELN